MLGVAAAAAVAAAVIVSVSKGRTESPAHRDTAAYIKSVDALQQQMRVELTKATAAYRDVAGGKSTASLEPRLLRAERTLQTLERRLAELPAPSVATRLRTLLLRLARSEVSLAHEVGKLAVFAPRFTTLLRRTAAAGSELSKGLADVKAPAAHRLRGTRAEVAKAQAEFATAAAAAAAQQADLVEAYGAELAAVAKALRRLRPPTVMAPAFRAQLRALAASQRAGDALAEELRKPVRTDVAVLGRRFTMATRSASSVSAQKARIAAVKRYNGRVRSIGALQSKIQSELARLQRATSS